MIIRYKRNHLFLSILLKAEKSGFSNKEMANANWPEIAELRKQNNLYHCRLGNYSIRSTLGYFCGVGEEIIYS
jgi:hypothetical protein